MGGAITDEKYESELCFLPEIKTVEIPWKPERGNETEEVCKIAKRILNKLTPQNFVILCNQFLQLTIDSEDKIFKIIDLIIFKAVNEPVNTKVYANLCKICSKMEFVNEADREGGKATFRKLLITKLQNQFEKQEYDVFDSDLEKCNNCSDSEERKEMEFELYKKKRNFRTGNIRFIGELYKLGILPRSIIFRCAQQFLKENEDIPLECLSVLFITVGKSILFGPANNPNTGRYLKEVDSLIDQISRKISEIARQKNKSNVSSRVRFMLQDVLDLRRNKWIPRRDDNNHKTIGDIVTEFQKECLETSMCFKYSHLINWTNNAQEDAKSKGADNHQELEDDGWISVEQLRRNRNKASHTASDKAQIQQNVKAGMKVDNKSANNSNQCDDFKRIKKKKKDPTAMGVQNVCSGANIPSEGEVSTLEPNYKKMLHNSFEPSKIQIKKQVNLPKGTPNCEPTKSEMSMAQVQRELLNLMKKKKPYNQVLNFILKNVGDRLEHPQFVSVLITAICEACITDSNSSFDQVNFRRYEKLFRQFLKNKEGREVESLNVIHNLLLRLEHPQGLITNIFNLFLVDDLISSNSFLKWRDDELNLEQKDISLTHLKSFLSTLEKSKDKKPTECTTLPQKCGIQNTLPTCQMSMDQVQEELLKLMKEKKQYAHILNFIVHNVDVDDLNFTHALVTAFCESCISDQNYTFDHVNFKRYEKLIKRFVKNEESRETASLNAIHDLVLRINHPEGLINNIFYLFLKDDLICRESFLKWKSGKEESKDKAISLAALATFFSTLEV